VRHVSTAPRLGDRDHVKEAGMLCLLPTLAVPARSRSCMPAGGGLVEEDSSGARARACGVCPCQAVILETPRE